jgi:leishmanolysin-like peptidase
LTEDGIADVDIVIFVTANGEECKRNLQYDRVLASSYSCYWDQYDRPIAGNIDICLNRLDDISAGDLRYSAHTMKEKVRTSSFGTETLLPQQVAVGANVSSVLCRWTSNTTSSEKEGDSLTTTHIDCDTDMDSPKNISSLATQLDLWLSNPSNRIEMIRKKTANIKIHEMAHLLGMTFYDMLHYRDWSTGLPLTPKPNVESVVCTGNNGTIKDLPMPSSKVIQKVSFPNGDSYYQVVTPTVVQVVRNQFQCQTLTGAPLGNQPTNPSNCIEAHWEERFFATEALSPVRDGVPQMVTPLTLALLKDTGWYWPNFNVVNASAMGFGAGCQFITDDCTIRNDDSIPSHGKNAFCNITIGDVSSSNSDTSSTQQGLGCDPSHTQVSRCDLIDYSTPLGTGLTPPPLPFQHFINPVGFL